MATKILYEKIKEQRLKLGLSQQELSNQTDVNVNTIKAVETGRMNTSYKNVQSIAERLGLDINAIYIKDFRKTKVIAVANNKGGSGKTSVVSNLGYALSEMDYKVLLVDSDMQMNLTYSYGLERNKEKSLNNAILSETTNLEEYITKTDFDNIDMIISDFDMAAIEPVLFTKTFRESIFKVMLKPLIDKGIYDFVLIDTNPTLGLLNFNILNASNYVIVPVEMTAFGVIGLEILIRFINDVRRANTNLKLLGVLRTKVDLRENITKEADSILTEIFGNNMMETSISIDTNIKKAQWNRKPLTVNTRARNQYIDLAKEVIDNVK